MSTSKKMWTLSILNMPRAPDKVHIFISLRLISWPNPMFDHLLESSHRDNSNKWSNIGFGEEITELALIEVNFTHLIWSYDACLGSVNIVLCKGKDRKIDTIKNIRCLPENISAYWQPLIYWQPLTEGTQNYDICATFINIAKSALTTQNDSGWVPVIFSIYLCSVPGLQLRKSEQNIFHDNFLISQPNPMMWPSLK